MYLLKINKFFLFITILFHYEIDFNGTQQNWWIDHCIKDLKLCPKCTLNRINSTSPEDLCANIFQQYVFNDDDDIIHTLNAFFGDREIQFARHTSGAKVVVKRLMDESTLNKFMEEMFINNDRESDCDINDEMLDYLKEQFYDGNRVGGSHICGAEHAIKHFIEQLPPEINELYAWLLLNLNIQPLILLTFAENGMPSMPRQLNLIGFSSVIEFKGNSLNKYFYEDDETRIKISQLLLKEALKLTEFHKSFNLYLTDLTLDNVVVNEDLTQISFIDLDNIILLYSNTSKYSKAKFHQKHVHEKIECDGCFAYSLEDICDHYLSDINVFATCQMLYEDLHENTDKGFLHSASKNILGLEKYQELMNELNKCVNCRVVENNENCDRFQSALQLMRILNELSNF